MNALHEQFVTEARDLIAQASDALISLERDGLSDAPADRILRAFHTLKGSGGLLDIAALTLTMHVAEELVAALRSRRVAMTPAAISQLLACLDLVAAWVDAFESHGELPRGADDKARDMSGRLRDLLAPDTASRGAEAPGLPGWAAQLTRAHARAIRDHVGSRAVALLAVSYEPHAGCFFDGDDPIQLLQRVPQLLALRVESTTVELPELDPFSCQLRFYAITESTRDQLATIFRQVPDQVRIVDIPREMFAASFATGNKDEIIRKVIAEQSEMLRAAQGDGNLAGRIGAAAGAAANALRHAERDRLADAVLAAGKAAQSHSDAVPLLTALQHAADGIGGDERGDGPIPGATAPHEDAANRWVRVAEARVDALVNLAGELIVLRNSFAHLARRVETEGGPDLSRAMRREHDAIDRLAAEFNEAVLRLRMVAVGQALRPLPRLVRDLSQRLGKKVQLVMRGEATESDKSVIDRLFEPLLHIVRNAIDHGIELPEDRATAGKAAMGAISITASRIGDRMVIEIADDGRGIDPTAVRLRAQERGLMPGETLAALSDAQALELIFAAGLSTAAEVTDVSGRGVGMDVVRKTVEEIGGRVSLTSRLGVGTTVRLDLPISIAIARIMVVETAGQRFGIAMDAVTETVRVTADRVRAVKNNEGFVLRDRVVPICSLAELMGLPRDNKRGSETRLLIVIEAGAKIAAVEVDSVRERIETVLKPMQGYLSGARGYSGTTILGDGSVLLVLDAREILP